jgi:hypothetical protein
MNPRFAIVQTRRQPLEPGKLRHAFLGVPGLAPCDADSVCSEGDGILCHNLSSGQAAMLQANLKAAGAEVEIVDESRLPALPAAKVIRRVKLTPQALLIADLLKGQVPVAWEQVHLLAAGSVQLTTIARKRTESKEVGVNPVHHMIPLWPVATNKVEYSTRTSADWFLRAEIILAGVTVRYSIEAEDFDFAPLGEGVTGDLAADFCLLVRQLAAHAPHAMLSRGAAAILSDPCEFAYYPRKGSFHDEIIWVLWRARQSAG